MNAAPIGITPDKTSIICWQVEAARSKVDEFSTGLSSPPLTFKNDADPVLHDPNKSARSNDSVRFRHQLESIWNVRRIWNANSSAIFRNVGD